MIARANNAAVPPGFFCRPPSEPNRVIAALAIGLAEKCHATVQDGSSRRNNYRPLFVGAKPALNKLSRQPNSERKGSRRRREKPRQTNAVVTFACRGEQFAVPPGISALSRTTDSGSLAFGQNTDFYPLTGNTRCSLLKPIDLFKSKLRGDFQRRLAAVLSASGTTLCTPLLLLLVLFNVFAYSSFFGNTHLPRIIGSSPALCQCVMQKHFAPRFSLTVDLGCHYNEVTVLLLPFSLPTRLFSSCDHKRVEFRE